VSRVARLSICCITVAIQCCRGVDFNAPRQLQTTQPVRDVRTIRVVTWNIDRGRELNRISSDLARSPADLCLLQEVDWNSNRTKRADIGAQLAQRLQLNLVYGIEFEELSQESEQHAFIGQATLTRLPVRAARVLRFREQSGFWQPRAWIPSHSALFQRRLGSRIALVTELEFVGQLLVVYNAHLESRSLGHLQGAQLQEIFDDLKRYPRDTPVILGGDLNTKYFPSRFLRTIESQGFRSATGKRVERTAKILALDWIFARGPIKIGSGAVNRSFSGSDHLPVFATIEAE